MLLTLFHGLLGLWFEVPRASWSLVKLLSVRSLEREKHLETPDSRSNSGVSVSLLLPRSIPGLRLLMHQRVSANTGATAVWSGRTRDLIRRGSGMQRGPPGPAKPRDFSDPLDLAGVVDKSLRLVWVSVVRSGQNGVGNAS